MIDIELPRHGAHTILSGVFRHGFAPGSGFRTFVVDARSLVVLCASRESAVTLRGEIHWSLFLGYLNCTTTYACGLANISISRVRNIV